MTRSTKFKSKSTGAKCRTARRTLVPTGGTPARANGEFRFANLRKGDYKVFTNELLDRQDLLTFDPRGQLYGYPTGYYPAAADFEEASIIHLNGGESFPVSLTPSRREYYP